MIISLFSKNLQHILHQSEEPLHHAEIHLRIKRFYVDLIIVNGHIAFTKEPMKNHLV